MVIGSLQVNIITTILNQYRSFCDVHEWKSDMSNFEERKEIFSKIKIFDTEEVE